MTEYWGGTIHFFLLTLYNFKNIGGGGGHVVRHLGFSNIQNFFVFKFKH